jgi:hypothetical protein
MLLFILAYLAILCACIVGFAQSRGTPYVIAGGIAVGLMLATLFHLGGR